MSQPPRRRRMGWRRIIALLIAIALLAVVGGVAWFAQPQQLLSEIEPALVSGADVTVEQTGGRITFAPTTGTDTGLILYPGGKVPAAGYALPARAIAEDGYLVVIVSMPLGFAVLDVDAGTGVMRDHPEIRHWAIGGHSLGGAMAGQFVASHPGSVEGLVLWAAYSATDVSHSGVATAIVYGSLDAGRDRFVSPASLALLPPDPTITVIEGGNHANFGSYTGQPNDPAATLPRDQQHAQAADATAALLDRLANAE